MSARDSHTSPEDRSACKDAIVPDVETFTFRVEGTEWQQTYLPTARKPFDETYAIDGEHPAEALEKLLHEIEWGILDSDEEFTITFLPREDSDV